LKICNNCAQQLSDEALFCSRCGAELATGQIPVRRKRRSTVWIVVGVLAGIFVLAVPMILILAAIAIPKLIRARVSANEASAVSGVRVIITSAMDYQGKNSQYPASLSALSSEGQLPADLAQGQKHGYRFLYEAEDTDGNGTLDVFSIHADPLVEDRTGRRHFFGDQTGVIRMSPGPEPATGESAPLQ
jgi:type IV pilus assembly protein PilA